MTFTKQLFNSETQSPAAALRAAVDSNAGDSADDMVFVDSGFFFFDFERAVRTFSNIAQIFDVAKLERFFGKELTNSKFFIKQARVYVNVADRDSTFESGWSIDQSDFENIVEMRADFSLSQDSHNMMRPYRTYIMGNSDHPNSYSSTGRGGFKSFLVTRSFDTADPSGLVEDGMPYRLACFQFQKVNQLEYDLTYNSYLSESDRHFLEFGLTVNDSTLQIYGKLKDDLLAAQADFSAYALSARANFSFNNSDGFFNSFFVDGFKILYADTPEEAPWVKIALLYAFHVDLVHNEYEGNIDRIMAEAKSITERISPTGGSLDEIQLFEDSLTTLVGHYIEPQSHGLHGNPIENYNNLILNGGLMNQELIFGRNPAAPDNTSRYTVMDLPEYQFAMRWEDPMDEVRDSISTTTVSQAVSDAAYAQGREVAYHSAAWMLIRMVSRSGGYAAEGQSAGEGSYILRGLDSIDHKMIIGTSINTGVAGLDAGVWAEGSELYVIKWDDDEANRKALTDVIYVERDSDFQPGGRWDFTLSDEYYIPKGDFASFLDHLTDDGSLYSLALAVAYEHNGNSTSASAIDSEYEKIVHSWLKLSNTLYAYYSAQYDWLNTTIAAEWQNHIDVAYTHCSGLMGSNCDDWGETEGNEYTLTYQGSGPRNGIIYRCGDLFNHPGCG